MNGLKKALGYLTVAALAAACGERGNQTELANDTSRGASQISVAPTPTPAPSNGDAEVQSQIQSSIPRLKVRAKALNVRAQACPTGVSKECLDALLLALANSRVLKGRALFAQMGLGYLSNGKDFMVYGGAATQPSYNTGFKIVRSEYKKGTATKPVGNLSAAVGDLLFTSPAPAGIVGAFGAITDGASLAGIAGGFAGADVTGWIEGAFYCYLAGSSVSGTGSPVGACVSIPITSGGW